MITSIDRAIIFDKFLFTKQHGIFNKRILKSHYSESQVDSLGKLLNSYIDGFYCYGGSCKFSKVEDDYFVSIKMSIWLYQN